MTMTQFNWYKWILFALIAGAMFYGGWKCGDAHGRAGCADTSSVITDTTTRIDSNVIAIPHQDPVKVVPRDPLTAKPLNIKMKPRQALDSNDLPGSDFAIFDIDTAAVINSFFATKYYWFDTTSKGTRVVLADTLTENGFAGRSVYIMKTDTAITTTVTKIDTVETTKQRVVVNIGAAILGSRKDPFYGIGPDIMLTDKKSVNYRIGMRFVRGGSTYYEAGYSKPIRFGKKRR